MSRRCSTRSLALAFCVSAPGSGPSTAPALARVSRVPGAARAASTASTAAQPRICTIVRGRHRRPSRRSTPATFERMQRRRAAVLLEPAAGVHVEVLNWAAIAAAVHTRRPLIRRSSRRRSRTSRRRRRSSCARTSRSSACGRRTPTARRPPSTASSALVPATCCHEHSAPSSRAPTARTGCARTAASASCSSTAIARSTSPARERWDGVSGRSSCRLSSSAARASGCARSSPATTGILALSSSDRPRRRRSLERFAPRDYWFDGVRRGSIRLRTDTAGRRSAEVHRRRHVPVGRRSDRPAASAAGSGSSSGCMLIVGGPRGRRPRDRRRRSARAPNRGRRRRARRPARRRRRSRPRGRRPLHRLPIDHRRRHHAPGTVIARCATRRVRPTSRATGAGLHRLPPGRLDHARQRVVRRAASTAAPGRSTSCCAAPRRRRRSS